MKVYCLFLFLVIREMRGRKGGEGGVPSPNLRFTEFKTREGVSPGMDTELLKDAFCQIWVEIIV